MGKRAVLCITANGTHQGPLWVNREINALREARSLGIPTVCLIDTDGDPDLADIAIPGNDDSMRSIEVA